jgi:hypothetical protein
MVLLRLLLILADYGWFVKKDIEKHPRFAAVALFHIGYILIRYN